MQKTSLFRNSWCVRTDGEGGEGWANADIFRKRGSVFAILYRRLLWTALNYSARKKKNDLRQQTQHLKQLYIHIYVCNMNLMFTTFTFYQSAWVLTYCNIFKSKVRLCSFLFTVIEIATIIPSNSSGLDFLKYTYYKQQCTLLLLLSIIKNQGGAETLMVLFGQQINWKKKT